MKTNYYNIPATNLAAEDDVEKACAMLSGSNLKLNNDGTVSNKESDKKLNDIPKGVLGSKTLREILEESETSENCQTNTDSSAKQDEKQKKKDIPSGVLGSDNTRNQTVSPEVEAMINEFRFDGAPVNEANNKDTSAAKKSDIPGGVLGAHCE